MKLRISLFLIFISLLAKAQTKEKDEAKKAFVEMVTCYFKKDCAKFYSFCNDSVALFNINTNGCVTSKQLAEKNKTCDNFPKYIEKTKSLEKYLSAYSVAVMDHDEYTSPDRSVLRKYFFEMSGSPLCLMRVNVFNRPFTKDDYLVIGDIPKEKKTENFIGGPYILMLHKTKKGWKITGLTE